MSDLSPQSGAKRTLLRSLSPIAILHALSRLTPIRSLPSRDIIHAAIQLVRRSLVERGLGGTLVLA